jgi:hypothetical protein
MFKNLLSEKRLSMNIIDFINSILLSWILYQLGIKTNFNYWIIVLVSSMFLFKAVIAVCRIIKFSSIDKRK